MSRHRKETDAYRSSGIGRKHPISAHYADGFKNGSARVAQDPQLRDWFATKAMASLKSQYADWPPYRAYQLGFARGARG